MHVRRDVSGPHDGTHRGTMARFVQAEGHPWGSTPEEYQELLAELENNWPSEYYIRGPGGAFGDADPETIAFMMRLFQAAASPAAAVALERMNAEVDIRDILPTIGVPALLMCRLRGRWSWVMPDGRTC